VCSSDLIALIENRWAEARKDFQEALSKGRFAIKAGALLGIICSYMKLNVEGIVVSLGRPRLQ
jgi:hypothetical protein